MATLKNTEDGLHEGTYVSVNFNQDPFCIKIVESRDYGSLGLSERCVSFTVEEALAMRKELALAIKLAKES